MSDAPTPPGRPIHIVECPECGENFSPRGIAAHRRMRHGIAPEAAVELAGTLSRIASVLERLDARLAPQTQDAEPTAAATPETALAEVRAALPSRPSPENPANHGGATRLLQEGIREVLAEIARVKRETEHQIAHLGGRPVTDEQKRLEQTAFVALASLRKRQAELIYKMQTDAGANGNSLDALTVL